LFDASEGVPKLVVTFLALLELARETLVDLSQQAPFSPIYVRLVESESAVE
jgi:segregation and condensation protein A